jgi:hypothetical protein
MKITKLKINNAIYFICIFLLVTVLILWFKIAIDNWNKEAIEYNKQMKNKCPCGKFQYVTKGHWECDCK